MDPPPDGAGKHRPLANNYITRPPQRASGAGSRLTIRPTPLLCRTLPIARTGGRVRTFVAQD